MTKKFSLLTILLFYTVINIYAQAYIKIINNNSDKVNVAFYEPYYGKFYNSELSSDFVSLSFKGTIVKSINIFSPIFMQLTLNSIPVYIVAEPGDTTVLRIKNQQNISNATPVDKWLDFESKNKDGLIFFNLQYNYPYRVSKFESVFNLIEKPILNKNSFMDSLKNILKISISKYDTLFYDKKISKDFMLLAKSTIKANLLNEALKPFQRGSKMLNKLNNLQLDSIMTEIYGCLNINDTLLTKGVLSNFYLKSYYDYKERKLKNMGISERIKDSVLVLNDTLSLRLNENFVPCLYAPKPVQEYLWGDLMLGIAELFPDGVDEESINVFKYYYPQSFFIESLITKYPLLNSKNKTSEIQPNYSGNKEMQFVDTLQKISNLNDLIKSHFSGKYVFIDLWASWCIPCKQEFAFNYLLDTFLVKKNIERLYISIDEAPFKNAWLKNIFFYNLTGFHVRASKELVDDIKKIIYKNGVFSIPRYILIGKNGEIIDADTPRPREPKLKDLIDKYLKE